MNVNFSCDFYERAFIKARENTAVSSTTKFYITENNGKKRVVVNTDITQGITDEILNLGVKKGSKDFYELFKDKTRDYIKSHYREISMPGTKYKTYLKERGAKEYVRSKDTSKMKGRQKYDKFRAADNIDEIVQSQFNSRLENTTHDRKDDFVSFYRSNVEIQVLDRVYTAELITGLTSDGKEEFYDVIHWDLQKIGEPYHNPSSAEAEFSGRPDSGSPVTEIVTQPSQEVKQSNENVKHSLSDDEENPTSRFRTNTIERATMFTPEDLEAISPTEFEYIPERDLNIIFSLLGFDKLIASYAIILSTTTQIRIE